MNVENKTETEVYELALKILLDRLGISGRHRFLEQCKPTIRNYTAERHKWLDTLDMETVMQEVQELRTQKQKETINHELKKNIHDLTDHEVYRVGLNAISQEIGPAGLIQFLRLCKSAKTLYATDDSEWVEKFEGNTILAENQKGKKEIKGKNKD